MARPFSRKGIPSTHSELVELLGNRSSRKLGNNTYAERRGDGSIAIRLHNTEVVTLFQNGKVRLDSGGWGTNTTRDRINAFIPYPYAVVQKNYSWTVVKHFHASNGEGRVTMTHAPFSDGMELPA